MNYDEEFEGIEEDAQFEARFVSRYRLDEGWDDPSFLLGRAAALVCEIKRDYHRRSPSHSRVDVNAIETLRAAQTNVRHFLNVHVGRAVSLYAQKAREKKYRHRLFDAQLEQIVSAMPIGLNTNTVRGTSSDITLGWTRQQSFNKLYADWRWYLNAKKEREEEAEEQATA